MALDFDFWPQRYQNGPYTTERSYSTPSEFYPNIRLGTESLKAFHKGFCTIEGLVQEPEEEQEV